MSGIFNRSIMPVEPLNASTVRTFLRKNPDIMREFDPRISVSPISIGQINFPALQPISETPLNSGIGIGSAFTKV